MNNSDIPLSTADEKLTAYLDGRLSAAESATFEREHPETVAERTALRSLRAALKHGSTAPGLRNTEFFNRQILREIGPVPGSLATAAPAAAPSLFRLWRLALAGAFCGLAAFGIYYGMVKNARSTPAYMAEVISMKTGDAALTARLIKEEGMTVVMIDGLEPMDEDFILN